MSHGSTHFLNIREAAILWGLLSFLSGCPDRHGGTNPPSKQVLRPSRASSKLNAIAENLRFLRISTTRAHISVGHGGTCAIANGGKLYCWGISLGPSDDSLPAVIPHSEPFVQVSRENKHACARTSTGEAWCVGWNDDGQIGATTTEKCTYYVYGNPEYVSCSGSVLRVDGLPPIADIVTGYARSCAVTRDGNVYCWGSGIWGMLGVIPSDPCDCAKSAVKVPNLENVQSLALGTFFSCALKTDGAVWCWGSNKEGQLGRGTRDARDRWDKLDKDAAAPPARVQGLTNIAEIAAGDHHVCALDRTRRKLWCWGSNRHGQFGILDVPESLVPLEVPLPQELGEVATIVAGGSATCALSTTGALFCWGLYQQDSERSDKPIPPRRIQGLPPLAAIAYDADRFCAVDQNGKVLSWGDTDAPDQLGYRSKPGTCDSGCWSPPTEISDLKVDILPP